MTIMKSKLQISALLFLFCASAALAQRTPLTPVVTPAIDPTTGLPVAAPPAAQSDWKDPGWKDPDIVLKHVDFNGLPLGPIADFIRDQFKEQFDVILPNPTGAGINELTSTPVAPTDWRNDTQLQLILKDVTASELFNAMNLVFENDKTPLRWELKVNGRRQVALLRVLVNPIAQHVANPEATEPLRRIYFVGDLIGDEKNGGMDMEEIIKTITDVWQMTDTANGKIQFHQGAQLLVVTGTPGQIQFVEQTLNALHQKVDLARHNLGLKTKAEESKN